MKNSKYKLIAAFAIFAFGWIVLFAGKEFTSTLKSISFTYNTPTSGTLKANIKSKGGRLNKFRKATGNFAVSHQGGSIYHVFAYAEATPTTYLNIKRVEWKTNYIVDNSDGSITSTSMEVKKIKQNDTAKISKMCSGTGSWTVGDPDSTTGSANGTF